VAAAGLQIMTDNRFEKSLRLAIIITSTFFVVEVIGGLISGSLSLLGDAAHMFRDVFALLISLSALNLAKKLPTKKKTFGYHRTEIFAAFVNGLLLIGISGWIFWEAFQRFSAPRPIKSVTMFIVALSGLLANLYVALKLRGSDDLNVKSAFLHVLTDTLSSAAVMFASVWIYFTNQTIVDPILGLVIAVFILFSSWTIIKDSIHILLEYTPTNVRFDDVIRDIERVRGVGEVHDVHLWTLCSNVNVIDAHIYTTEKDLTQIEIIKSEIKRRLQKYNIKHATFEFECEECEAIDQVRRIQH
jgi:cobalt-zinc-cadmium efflux system protein